MVPASYLIHPDLDNKWFRSNEISCLRLGHLCGIYLRKSKFVNILFFPLVLCLVRDDDAVVFVCL